MSEGFKIQPGWSSRTPIDYPEDIGLAIPSNMSPDDIPDHFIDLYLRFYSSNYINQLGASCILQSHLLRRIMRLHKIDASVKQVVMYWRNDKKGHNVVMGNPHENLGEGEIDVHMVVKSENWLLDFACSKLHYRFGYTAPRGIIVPWTKELSKNYVDLGIGGKVSYVENNIPHPKIKNVRLAQREDELKFTREYFERYDF